MRIGRIAAIALGVNATHRRAQAPRCGPDSLLPRRAWRARRAVARIERSHRRAHSNSMAKTPIAAGMTTTAGPGSTIIATPTASSAPPPTNTATRRSTRSMELRDMPLVRTPSAAVPARPGIRRGGQWPWNRAWPSVMTKDAAGQRLRGNPRRPRVPRHPRDLADARWHACCGSGPLAR